jgi:iron complex outermembrane receptor protein
MGTAAGRSRGGTGWTVFFLAAAAAAAAATGVQGVVRDSTGQALPGVTLKFEGPTVATATTGPDGGYHVDLPKGAYTVTARAAGFADVTGKVDVSEDRAATLDLTLTVGRGETLVVTASKQEAAVVDAPATMTVLTEEQIANTPGTSYGDVLRSVPGLNVTQLSARDVQVASRQAATTLSNTELAVIDGRTIETDFFGIVFWDLVPTEMSDIKQIEVVRGPASAVWGANAVTGVVNIVTKRPREAPGGTVELFAGGFSRDAGTEAGLGPGLAFGGNLSYSAAPNDTWSYRVSAGYFDSDPLPRPTGQIPLVPDPAEPSLTVGGGSYADNPYTNSGTRQPKFDLRVDQELPEGARLDYSAGIAGTRGIIQSPIGPFLLEKNSYLGYVKAGYVRRALHVALFGNFLDGSAPNLIAQDPSGSPVNVDFKTQTYDLEIGDSSTLGTRNVLTYGGNFRQNEFNISIAPGAPGRSELGGYLQEELLLDKFRFAASARVDKFGNLQDPFVSARAMAMYKPTPNQSVRFSFNRAFRDPNVIDNYLDLYVLEGSFPLGALNPALEGLTFPIIAHTVGNPNLSPVVLKAWEAGYTGTIGRATLGLSFYLNDSDNNISSFTTYYSSQNPPPGWPLPPQVLDLLAQQGVVFPELAQRTNFGALRNKGIEASFEQAISPTLSAFANYSYQAPPENLLPQGDPNRFPADEITVPPKNRFNAGVNWNGPRWIGSASVNYVDRGFWADVLDDRYHGYTQPYTLVNATIGIKWGRRITTSVRATNILNQDAQQHIFGDILKRSILADVKIGL